MLLFEMGAVQFCEIDGVVWYQVGDIQLFDMVTGQFFRWELHRWLRWELYICLK
jgi:hypothetical protein